MNTAYVNEIKRGPAQSGERGLCPGCGEGLIGKCGEIMAWHWSHIPGAECDRWGEPEGPWHREWKNAVAGGLKDRQEVRISEGAKWHMADAIAGDGWVVELQHSPLSPAEVREREAFYTRTRGGMIWVFDFHTYDRHRRDLRLDTAECLRLLDTGQGVVGLVAGSRAIFGRWSAVEAQRRIAGPAGARGLQAIHDAYVDKIAADAWDRARAEAARVEYERREREAAAVRVAREQAERERLWQVDYERRVEAARADRERREKAREAAQHDHELVCESQLREKERERDREVARVEVARVEAHRESELVENERREWVAAREAERQPLRSTVPTGQLPMFGSPRGRA